MKKLISLLAIFLLVSVNIITPLSYAQEAPSNNTEYTVTFDANRWTIVNSQIVADWEKVMKPKNPEFPWYSFEWWYSDENLTQEFDFNSSISNDTTLFAKWTYLWTIKDLNVYFIKDEETISHFTIMDRNLWATEVYNQNYENPNTESYWYYYQWWNNYWFGNDPENFNYSHSQVPYNTRSKYMPSKYASGNFVIWTQANFYNWMGWSTSTDNIWWGRSDNTTDKQWPCPTGYHVPSKAEWETISKYWYKEREWDVAYYSVDGGGKNFASVLLLPIAGYISFESNTWEEPPVREHPWNWATYRASTNNYNSDSNPNNPDSEHNGDALTFWALNSYLSFNWVWRAGGNSVRCFKDSVSPEITINQNGWKNAIIAIDWDKITTLTSPTRDDGKTFEWWYADQWFTQKIETWSTVPNELFAKWEGDETINWCIGMDQANVTASATQWVITLRWNAISWDTVQISIFDPNDMEYKNLWSVNMDTEEFDYTMQWDWMHNFILNNWCSDFHYQFDISMSELYSEEFLNAYNWAYSNWIISQSIYESRLFDLLTNEEFVDIMNNFTENLWITPDTNVSCTFSDRGTRTTPKQQTIINKFCQLWLTSSESDNISFEPEAYTIRTIFGTALSRALRWNQYEWWDPYYTNHLNALKAAWIINDIEEPESQREIKWYALLMLMRANEIYNEKATLVNNLTKSIAFPTNEVTKKVVFSWTYTAKENHTIHWISIENNDSNNDTDTCYNDIIFYTYINWEQVESDNWNIVLNSCWWTHYTRFDENININKWESINIIIEWELNSALFEDTDKEANYSYKLTFYSTGWYEDNLVSENLSPIKIINTSALSVLTWHQERTVYLKERNSTIAEFTIKPSAWNSSYLDKLVLEISQTEIEDDDIRLKIDGTEYESTSSNNWFITYQPDIEIPSEWVPAKIILKQEPEYDDFTIWINVKSINGETIDKLFSKRFVSALVYISKQENKWDYTKFTLWVDKSNNNYSIASVCMLTWSNGAWTCLFGENYADWPFEDWYSFEVINANFSQSINHIDYHVTVDPENNIEAPISIEKEDYPDYFKIWSWESRKIFSRNSSQCIGMESANITHIVSWDTITLKWNAIDWDTVYVYIFDPETETYISLWSWRMSDEKFDYKIQRNGQQNFKLTNWCRDSYYRVDVSLPEQYSEELVSAYNRAYEKWIISETPINNAKLYNALTNLELADIMNRFAENVLWIQPNTSLSCTFNDTSSLTQEEQNIIKKACQLWLMPGDRTSTSFNPNDTGNRATFGTALSRALWWDQNEWWTPYYSGHLNALKIAWIMNQIDNPEDREEIKWYILVTLMRAATNEIDCNDATIMLVCQDPESDIYENCPRICRKNNETWNINTGNNAHNNTAIKEGPKTHGYSGWWRSSSTSKKFWWNTATKTDNKKDAITSNNEKWKTINDSIEKPIDYMIPTINNIEYNEWNSLEVLENGFTREQNNAYGFAYANWITTIKNIEKANLNWAITRAAMAKMLSNYAINVLGKEPDTSKAPHFWDISKETDRQYDNWITLAYQLWIMWVWTKNFRPYDPVTRKEFVTVLSRMLYNTLDWTSKTNYYEPHMAKLYDEWIITKTNPAIIEKRWYVMTMLMRSAK